jgi:hypothetical protein
MKPLMDNLPEAAKARICDTIKSKLGPMDDDFAKLAWIPGVGDTIKPASDEVIGKFASLGGLPTPQTANVSGELAGVLSSMAKTLSTIREPASVDAALPKLKELNNKLDESKGMVAALPESGKSTINALLKIAIAKLKKQTDKVVSIEGVGDKVKPVIDSIMGKLDAMTA